MPNNRLHPTLPLSIFRDDGVRRQCMKKLVSDDDLNDDLEFLKSPSFLHRLSFVPLLLCDLHYVQCRELFVSPDANYGARKEVELHLRCNPLSLGH